MCLELLYWTGEGVLTTDRGLAYENITIAVEFRNSLIPSEAHAILPQ